MRTKIFHPEHKKIKPIFKRKPNQNQKKIFKIQTKTQPQTETKFSKTKSISNRKLKLKSQNQTETLTRIFKTKSKPQSKPNRKENKLRRSRIENEVNFIVISAYITHNTFDNPTNLWYNSIENTHKITKTTYHR